MYMASSTVVMLSTMMKQVALATLTTRSLPPCLLYAAQDGDGALGVRSHGQVQRAGTHDVQGSHHISRPYHQTLNRLPHSTQTSALSHCHLSFYLPHLRTLDSKPFQELLI